MGREVSIKDYVGKKLRVQVYRMSHEVEVEVQRLGFKGISRRDRDIVLVCNDLNTGEEIRIVFNYIQKIKVL